MHCGEIGGFLDRSPPSLYCTVPVKSLRTRETEGTLSEFKRHPREIVPVFLLALCFLSGCVATERIYVTQVEATGPIALPPVIPTMELSESGAIAIVPHFGVNTDQKIVGRLDPVGATPQWGGNDNLVWRIPESEGGLDFQVSVGPSVALLAGGMLGGVDGDTYGNLRGGLGVFTVKENAAIRVDVGVQLLSIRSRVRTTVETDVSSIFGNASYRSNFDDTRDQTSFSPYVGLTFNTVYGTSPVNFLVNLGVSGQPLFNFHPTQPDTILGRGDLNSSIESIHETIAVYSCTPALCVQLGGGNQLLAGARLIGNFGIDNASPSVIWRPFVQVVLHF